MGRLSIIVITLAAACGSGTEATDKPVFATCPAEDGAECAEGKKCFADACLLETIVDPLLERVAAAESLAAGDFESGYVLPDASDHESLRELDDATVERINPLLQARLTAVVQAGVDTKIKEAKWRDACRIATAGLRKKLPLEVPLMKLLKTGCAEVPRGHASTEDATRLVSVAMSAPLLAEYNRLRVDRAQVLLDEGKHFDAFVEVASGTLPDDDITRAKAWTISCNHAVNVTLDEQAYGPRPIPATLERHGLFYTSDQVHKVPAPARLEIIRTGKKATLPWQTFAGEPVQRYAVEHSRAKATLFDPAGKVLAKFDVDRGDDAEIPIALGGECDESCVKFEMDRRAERLLMEQLAAKLDAKLDALLQGDPPRVPWHETCAELPAPALVP